MPMNYLISFGSRMPFFSWMTLKDKITFFIHRKFHVHQCFYYCIVLGGNRIKSVLHLLEGHQLRACPGDLAFLWVPIRKQEITSLSLQWGNDNGINLEIRKFRIGLIVLFKSLKNIFKCLYKAENVIFALYSEILQTQYSLSLLVAQEHPEALTSPVA